MARSIPTQYKIVPINPGLQVAWSFSREEAIKIALKEKSRVFEFVNPRNQLMEGIEIEVPGVTKMYPDMSIGLI